MLKTAKLKNYTFEILLKIELNLYFMVLNNCAEFQKLALIDS